MRPLFPVALVAAVVLSAAIHLVAILVPSLRVVFQTFALAPQEWLVLLALSASIIPMIEVLKLLQRIGFIGRELGPMSRRTP
jgi:Ca2+-transporting ATPase